MTNFGKIIKMVIEEWETRLKNPFLSVKTC